jgi:hypothetical protein
MFKMKKLFRDTLMINGKWNSTKITWFVSVIMMCLLGLVITLISYLQPENKAETPFKIFESFAWLVFGLSGVVIANKVATALTTNTEK